MTNPKVEVKILLEKIKSITDDSEARMNKAKSQSAYAFERGIISGLTGLKMKLGIDEETRRI